MTWKTARLSCFDLATRDHMNTQNKPHALETRMDWLQPLIILMGLSGQLLIAKKNPAGYACWIIGNISLMFVYADLHQYGLMGLQAVNTLIQIYALNDWLQGFRQNKAVQPTLP